MKVWDTSTSLAWSARTGNSISVPSSWASPGHVHAGTPVSGGGACTLRRVALAGQRCAVDRTVVSSIEPRRRASVRAAGDLVTDQEPREHSTRRGQSGADEHRRAKATRKDSRIAIGSAGQAGEPWNHRDGQEACAPRDRIVDAGRNTGAPRGRCRKDPGR